MHAIFRRTIIFVVGVGAWFATPLLNHETEAQTLTANVRAHSATPQAIRPTDEVLARERGLSLKQIRGLRERFGLSNGEIEKLPQPTLQMMLWQLAHPMQARR